MISTCLKYFAKKSKMTDDASLKIIYCCIIQSSSVPCQQFFTIFAQSKSTPLRRNFFCNPLLVSVKSFYLVAATVPTPKFQFSASWFEIWSLISQSNQGLLSSKLFHTFLRRRKNRSTIQRNPVDVNLSAPLLIKRIVVDPIVTPHIKYINTSQNSSSQSNYGRGNFYTLNLG